jgi:hypothetical protein
MRIRSLIIALFALAGCNSPSTRTITGQLRTQGYALDNPVVVAESGDHRVFYSHMAKDGSFTLQLPTNVAYRITLANSTRTPGVFTSVAKINWPLAGGASRWAVVGAGDTLALGGVYRRGTIPTGGGSGGVGIQCDHCGGGSDGGASGGGGDDCKEYDNSKCESGGHDDDCDSDHEHKDDDHCDKDDDADKHDHDCDDHDKGDGDHGDDDDDGHCGCGNSDGGSSGGGGSGGGGSGGGGGTPPGACAVNADCQKGQICVSMVCTGGTVP